MKCFNLLVVIFINIVVCASFSLQGNVDIRPQDHNHSQVASNETNSIIAESITRKHLKHRTFIPFARPSKRPDADNETEECSDSSDDFPEFLTEHARTHGGVVLCFIIGIYCFTLLAVVCDKYFLPCVEVICEVLNLTPDVAAATFMSVATSCPEMFTNIIGTFVTESDIGIGTIVGSSMFQCLGVASIGGLASITPLQLDWWPVTRDVIIYAFAVSLLVAITWDEYVYWYEALVLFIVYFIYFFVMFQNNRISKYVKSKFGDKSAADSEEPTKTDAYIENNKPGLNTQNEKSPQKLDEEDDTEKEEPLFRMPKGSKFHKFFFFYSWPIRFCLRFTIPNPKVHRKLFPITFIMCIVWIGTNSYLVSWMMSNVGSVFKIPDAVLGLTFLAAGSSLPESISMAIISRRGEGAFGVSNALGANTMNILFSLGMPWFFKTISKGTGPNAYIYIQSGSIEYTILGLIAVASALYIVLFTNKFRLGKRSGAILFTIYLCCVALAILSEMVFFDNSTDCD